MSATAEYVCAELCKLRLQGERCKGSESGGCPSYSACKIGSMDSVDDIVLALVDEGMSVDRITNVIDDLRLARWFDFNSATPLTAR